MLGQYLIMFREGFEAALIIAIILAYLSRTGGEKLSRYVWYGAYLAIAASLGLGLFIWMAYGILSKSLQSLFESVTAFIATGVLSSIIYWMAIKGKHMRQEIEQQIEVTLMRGSIFGLISFSFIVVFREGLESVLFLAPFFLSEIMPSLVGTVAGLITAVMLSYGIFITGVKINLKTFFYYSSILLILVAGGLIGYGAHELIEYFEEIGVEVGWLAKPVYTLNITNDNILHHKNIVGSILAVMFGYTVKAEWLRVIVHFTYLTLALPLIVHTYKKRE